MPMFDPKLERVGARSIWVRLPGLPVHFWTEQIFKQIGDAMGKFLTYDDSFISSRTMAYARILVYMDLTYGLPEFINIQ